MTWVWFSLLSAFFDSFVHLLSKKTLNTTSHYLVPATMSLITAFICALWACYIGIPKLDIDFFLLAVVASAMGAAGMVFFMSGLQSTEMSYAIPLLCFGPIFTVLWEWLCFSQSISLIGLLGVIIVLAGTYLLELDKASDGVLTPVKALYHNNGARLVFLASFIWSLSSMLDKAGVIRTNAVIWTAVVNIFIALFLFSIGFLKKKNYKKGYKRSPLDISSNVRS